MKLILAFALTVACVSAASLESIVTPGFPEGRIINGKPAGKGAAPYIVSLNSGSHFCAGSIINEKWVATAAHCLIYDSFQVIAGLHERNDESDVQVRRVASKAQQIIHEKYSGGVGPYDIGLIYIAEPFDLNTLSRDGSAPVAKISLPSGNYQQTGQGALYGWGRNNVGAVPNALQTLDVNIIGYAECKAALPSSAPIHPVNICTHTPGAIDGACNGDSGGPLIINTEDGSELVGIVSWGYNPCATTTYPSVFTSVSTQMSWIAEKVNSYKP